MKDHYEILGIERNSTEHEIKKRFRKLATIHHPDKNQGSEASGEKFKEVLGAYGVLSDKTKRAKYDYELLTKGQFTNTENYDPNYKPSRKETVKSYFPFNRMWVLILISILLWYFLRNNKSKENIKSKRELEEQESNRPETGEINFEKK